MHRIEKGCCPVKSEKGRIFQDLRNAFERPIALIIDLVAGNAFSPGIAFFRRSATYISKHGVSPFPTLQPIVFSYSAVSRRQEGYQLKVAHFESCLEGKALRFVRHDKFTVFQGFPQVFYGSSSSWSILS